jgi:hypothetical protein
MSDHGCVTAFTTEDGRRITVWRYTNDDGSNRFTFLENGEDSDRLNYYDPGFAQAIGAELHRLATEVGQLRRREIERARRSDDFNASAVVDAINDARRKVPTINNLVLSRDIHFGFGLSYFPGARDPDSLCGLSFTVAGGIPDSTILLMNGRQIIGMISRGHMSVWT